MTHPLDSVARAIYAVAMGSSARTAILSWEQLLPASRAQYRAMADAAIMTHESTRVRDCTAQVRPPREKIAELQQSLAHAEARIEQLAEDLAWQTEETMNVAAQRDIATQQMIETTRALAQVVAELQQYRPKGSE